LDFEISFYEGLTKDGCVFPDALELLGDAYDARGRFVDSVRIDRQLRELKPTDPLVRYNLACSLTRTGHFELAAKELEQALDLGYQDMRQLREDPDLEDLRSHPAYRRVREKIRHLKGQ
jgi:tetratricopeptide (TPR) repeat protein